jgi:hypothetical protein
MSSENAPKLNVRSSIVSLCSILHKLGIEDIDPNVIRKAKFDECTKEEVKLLLPLSLILFLPFCLIFYSCMCLFITRHLYTPPLKAMVLWRILHGLVILRLCKFVPVVIPHIDSLWIGRRSNGE